MDFKKTTFAVVTGASQGIGRCIAIELSKRLCNGSAISLIARNNQALKDVEAIIVSINGNIAVKVLALDLCNPDVKQYENLFNVNSIYEQGIIFHNAGQIGTLNASIELTDLQKWHDYYDLNFFSAVILNSVFIKRMRELGTHNLSVVNISSLVGSKPFANMAMYGSGKAARSIYFKVLALEESNVKVLNYCPGPVETAMVEEVVALIKNEDMRKNFINLRETKTILLPEQTVKKLLSILEKGEYKSGDIIDYYDRI